MHVMLTMTQRYNMRLKMQGMPNAMQLIWLVCNARHARCKCNANMDNLSNRIIMLQPLMKQSCNKHETSMQWWLKMVKGKTLIHLKTVPKSAQNDGQTLMPTCKPMDLRLRYKKGALYF